MTQDLFLRRKWILRAHGEQVVFVKRVNERREHVLMKAFLWALYLPEYQDLRVEVPVDDRSMPDVVSANVRGEPRFWGEAGQMSPRKIGSLVKRFPDTHFALAKWDAVLDPFIETVREALVAVPRRAPFDLLLFPPDSAERFVGRRGEVDLQHGDLDWCRIT